MSSNDRLLKLEPSLAPQRKIFIHEWRRVWRVLLPVGRKKYPHVLSPATFLSLRSRASPATLTVQHVFEGAGNR